MNRSVFVTVLMGLVVVLAGCSGGVTDETTTTGAGAGNDVTTTTTQTTTMGEPYTASGDDLDATTLAGAHEAALKNAGSFTNQLNISVDTTNGTLDLNAATRVNLNDGTATQTNLLAFDEFRFESTVYTAGSSSYERTYFQSNDSEYTEYRQGSEPYTNMEETEPVDVTESMQIDIVTDTVDGADWTQVGVEQFDGVSVTRYEAKGVESFRDLREDIDPASNQTITNAQAVLLVDENGIARFIEIRFDVEDDDVSGTIYLISTMTDVGTTTVAEPDWLDRAKQS
ncbi:hypothetical protein [Haladaptatus sp. DJG-WS-42]|uniref:DUF7537 family lipoprotein n=1 Tax=Haladaptatus sp. DJG-WS-42 TaxID=3120516 RepID=UPI0030D22F73